MSTKSLCGNAGRPHAQEIEACIEETEDSRADSHGTKVNRIIEVTGNARVDHAQEWHGYIRENHRRCDSPDVAILRQVGSRGLLRQ